MPKFNRNVCRAIRRTVSSETSCSEGSEIDNQRFFSNSRAVSGESSSRLGKFRSPLGRTSTVPSERLYSASGRLPSAAAASGEMDVTPGKPAGPSFSARIAESSFFRLGSVYEWLSGCLEWLSDCQTMWQ